MAFLGCSATKPALEPEAERVPIDTTFARASLTSADHGMVVCAHPLAAAAGEQILEAGGNACDAALAALAMLNVVEPHASGLGGGGFALYYDAQSDSAYLLDYREMSPSRMTRAGYFDPADTLHLVQRSGGKSILVPGAAAGWQALHRKFGTKTLPELYASAIAVADTGYFVSEKQGAIILDNLETLARDSLLSATFLDQALPPPPGFRVTQPKLASLLQFLSNTRLENFYFPPVSSQVTAAIRANGGFVSESDLNRYHPVERTPLRAKFHGYDIITSAPPAGGGLILIETLKLLEDQDLRSMGLLSPVYIHTVATAIRQARTDAAAWLGDPGFERIPLDTLLSDSYISDVRNSFSQDSVPQRMTALDSIRAFGPGNTTHLVVADKDGNLVSLTQSINYFFGSGVAVPELGLLLNNHAADFDYDTTGRNPIAPLRRPVSSMAPTIILKDGAPVMLIGTPGGSRIPAALAQVILAVLEFDLPLDEALNLPRFFPAGLNLVYETRLPDETLEALAAKGWKPYADAPISNYFGGVQAIHFRDAVEGRITGSSDPRRDGAAIGY
ncbi:MAG: gamma-glutamyltransferase [Calditrichaeota bacterium]|nr:gamma-glutamyltransferase [Calditrichota bacterium]